MPRIPRINVFDIPTSAGCLERGTEALPAHFRKHGLFDALCRIGMKVNDLGQVSVPEEPRHNSPPIRNFPLPKIVWEKTLAFLEPHFSNQSVGLTIGLGGDCSIVVGSIAAASKVFGKRVHLLYLDGDIDSIAPNSERCVGSAGMGLWFLTQPSEFWTQGQISPSQVTVIGNKKQPETDLGIASVPLENLGIEGVETAVSRVLSSIPQDAVIVVHFDVDLLSGKEMPAAYAPRPEGLNFSDTAKLLKMVLEDPRVRYLEISEFVPSRDSDGHLIRKLIEVLTYGLSDEDLLKTSLLKPINY